jgi:hypothetical protein
MLLTLAVVAALAGVVAYSAQHQLTTRPAQSEAVAPTFGEPVKALSAPEEAYAEALWPIHREIVETSAVILSSAGLNYVLEDHDIFKLVARLRPLEERFQTAMTQTRALPVPTSLEPVRDQYLTVITDYQNAVTEMLKIGHDADDEHLMQAHAMTEQASKGLVKVCDVLWPGEHRPN